MWSTFLVTMALLASPIDETRRFPAANLVDTKLVEQHLMGKPFMPGGTLANYKKGKIAYNMFLAKLPAPDAVVGVKLSA